MGKKICVVFPGIGYHSDKPLLYYGKKYMSENGYEIVDLKYGKLPTGLRMHLLQDGTWSFLNLTV